MKSFKWSLVTSRDFGRANKWSRTQPRLLDIIKAKMAKNKLDAQSAAVPSPNSPRP
jgi:hypothetical protein